MAFSSSMETRRRGKIYAISEEVASSFFSDSQTSWVVFNPSEQRASDILSSSTEESHFPIEDESDEVSENSINIILESERSFKERQGSKDLEDEDLRDYEVMLSNRIDQWQKSTDTSHVSDNVASWDIDEGLAGQDLDTTILDRVPAYYGDMFFHNMSKAEYLRFRKRSFILKRSLTRKGCNASNLSLIPRLLELIKWKELLGSSGSLVDDYVSSTLSRANLQYWVFNDIEISDTVTSSSLVMCGGSGGGSWNDI